MFVLNRKGDPHYVPFTSVKSACRVIIKRRIAACPNIENVLFIFILLLEISPGDEYNLGNHQKTKQKKKKEKEGQ